MTSQQKIAVFLDEKVGEIDSVIAKTKETILEKEKLLVDLENKKR